MNKKIHYRRFLLLLAMLKAVTFANAQIIVDASETVELMAILSRTAGFREYCMDMGGQYTKDTELALGSIAWIWAGSTPRTRRLGLRHTSNTLPLLT